MKKLLVLGLVLLLLGCSQTPSRMSKEELIKELEGSNAQEFNREVSVVYQIFPIAFANSDESLKGDLQGIIDKLDYLNDGDPTTTDDLGIDAIWLNPISQSGSTHKYDVLDYQSIDRDFGSLDTFKALVKACDERGIKLILDMVVNHTAYGHPWFQKFLNDEKPYDQYYVNVKELDRKLYPDTSKWYKANNKYYFAFFWDQMPEINADNEMVREEWRSIFKFWLDLGVDGFRFDAAKHVYYPAEYPAKTPTMSNNVQFWLEMRKYIKSVNDQAYLIAEVWESNAIRKVYAPAFDAMFNFDFSTAVIGMLNSGNTSGFMTKYLQGKDEIMAVNPNFIDSPFLTNHDQDRVMSQLQGNMIKAKQAAHLLLTFPGIPYIYYGEELGMQGYGADYNKREPYIWHDELAKDMALWEPITYNKDTVSYDAQSADPNSLLSTYRKLIALRKEYPTLRFGDIAEYDMQQNGILAYRRYDQQMDLLIIHNMLDRSFKVNLNGYRRIYSSGVFDVDVVSAGGSAIYLKE
jgi:alpha-amylase